MTNEADDLQYLPIVDEITENLIYDVQTAMGNLLRKGFKAFKDEGEWTYHELNYFEWTPDYEAKDTVFAQDFPISITMTMADFVAAVKREVGWELGNEGALAPDHRISVLKSLAEWRATLDEAERAVREA